MESLIIGGVDLAEFLGIPYEASRHPGNTSVEEFLRDPSRGANCQLFALGVLREAGFYIDDEIPMDQNGRFGSQELWRDELYTEFVWISGALEAEDWKRLDVDGHKWICDPFTIWFAWPQRNAVSDIKNLHVGICLGEVEGYGKSCILHNAKPGPSGLWTLSDFYEKGYDILGVKRIRNLSIL